MVKIVYAIVLNNGLLHAKEYSAIKKGLPGWVVLYFKTSTINYLSHQTRALYTSPPVIPATAAA